MRTEFDKYLFTKAFMEENARKDQKKEGATALLRSGLRRIPAMARGSAFVATRFARALRRLL
jgi:hypothetical protein